MLWVLLAWYVLGVALTIWEMHFDEDVDTAHAAFALVIGLFGPLMLIRTLVRRNNRVLLRKHHS